MRFNFQQIVSYCLGLHTQNPGLREVVTRSTCWNKAKKLQKKASRIVQSGLTWVPALREVDWEPSAKRGANRTEALLRAYWSSRSLHIKEPPNRISYKTTTVDPIRSSRTWKKSSQFIFSCCFASAILRYCWWEQTVTKDMLTINLILKVHEML